MSKWIYTKDGKNYGPMKVAKIAKAIFNSELELNDYILSAETQTWHKIKDIPEIMDIIHKPRRKHLFEDIDDSLLEEETED
ncbi:MAG: hypothetical protein GX294_07265 [Candidatus Cloacimonetes bacterium]|nr:hypothetical protein [Candidatus Cloacimonadota bacterium]